MALGPQNAKRRHKQLLAAVEATIDDAIRRSSGGVVSIAVEILGSQFSASDWPELEKRYKAAGWRRAKYVSDQRDGDYIELEA